jgi:PHD/YefM family antitoxin component YafN of YafNO toxin-antitoxin module
VAITTLTSRQLNQDVGRAKKAAEDGPVVITDRGRPAHVLMTYATYRRLTTPPTSLAEALHQRGGEDIEFEPPKLGRELFKPFDFDE